MPYSQPLIVSWLSRAGLTNPSPEGFHGLGWLATFSGGLVTTCGLTQVGYTEEDAREGQGCHGRISNIPATVEWIVQPDPANGRMEMSITAVMNETRVFGPHLELRRTISSTLGKANIKIQDRVTNRGNTSSPHMLMYHCNFGYPLVDEGTEIIYNGTCRSRGLEMDDAIFNGADFKTCKPVLDAHSGSGEACGFIEMEPDEEDRCSVGLLNRRLGLGVMMKYSKEQLPCLTNWQHWGAGEYVCALEPGTNFPIGQLQAREQGVLILLEPGESRSCELEFDVLSGLGT